jgi:uncharacterized protein with PIN domain
MIVDTSALVAIFKREPGYELLRDAIGLEGGNLPAPALVEYTMVTGTARFAEANLLMDTFREQGLVTQHSQQSMPPSPPRQTCALAKAMDAEACSTCSI